MIYGITIDEEYLCTDTHENDLDFQHDEIIGLVFKEINTKYERESFTQVDERMRKK